MATVFDVLAPVEQSEGTKSRVARWLKNPGDTVVSNEPLVELESDKVTFEIPSPASGVLSEIFKQEQAEVLPNDLLARIDTGAMGADSAGAADVVDVARPVATPAPAQLVADGGAKVSVVPHSPVRKRIAEHMVESLLRTAPHVTTVFEADLGGIVAHRARHRAEFERQGAHLTLTAYFVAACVDAIRAVPETNSRWTDEALEIFSDINIGVAVAVPGKGLLVPVLHDVANRNLLDIARQLGDLTNRARQDRLTPADMRGGTFTISNHGVSGSLFATPIVIHQPQSAILGIGKLEKRAVVLEQEGADMIAVRQRCYVSLTLDHRVMDGERANLFLRHFVQTLESWMEASPSHLLIRSG